MVLYALVVAFLSFTLTTYFRFRDFEARYTKLARRLALDEAGPPLPAQAVPEKQEKPYAGS
jgi:small membrane protein